jgi:hypothetical protein
MLKKKKSLKWFNWKKKNLKMEFKKKLFDIVIKLNPSDQTLYLITRSLA